MTDAAALAVINLTSKSVHSGYSSKEPVMIYYSLSCTRAFINALDVSHIFLFIFREERGFLFHRHFSPKRILQHLRLHFFVLFVLQFTHLFPLRWNRCSYARYWLFFSKLPNDFTTTVWSRADIPLAPWVPVFLRFTPKHCLRRSFEVRRGSSGDLANWRAQVDSIVH